MSKVKETKQYFVDEIMAIDKKNGEYYKKIFDKMGNKEFDIFMHALKNKETYLSIYLPNMKSSLSVNKITELAKRVKILLFDKLEQVNSATGRKFYSISALILQMSIRRVKQFIMEERNLPNSDKHVSKLTGQVMPPDKGAKMSIVENQMLATKNLNKSIVEMNKIRGGDLANYYLMKQEILTDGRTNLESLQLSNSKPKSVKVAERFFKAIHLDISLDK